MTRQSAGVARVVVSAIVALLLALSGLLTLAVPVAQSASFLIRLEAGPQPAGARAVGPEG